MKLLLITLLLIPSLLHARPLIIRVSQQSDVDLSAFESWANELVDRVPRWPNVARIKRIKVIEQRYQSFMHPPLSFERWREQANGNLINYTGVLGTNPPAMLPILRRANVWSLPGISTEGYRYVGGLAWVLPYPLGYTNPRNYTAGIAYTTNWNAQGEDRLLQSYITILHEAFHTLGAGHQSSTCNIMYGAVQPSYAHCGASGPHIGPSTSDLVQRTVAKSLRRFRAEMRNCRLAGVSKRTCVRELGKVDRPLLANKRPHTCGALH